MMVLQRRTLVASLPPLPVSTQAPRVAEPVAVSQQAPLLPLARRAEKPSVSPVHRASCGATCGLPALVPFASQSPREPRGDI